MRLHNRFYLLVILTLILLAVIVWCRYNKNIYVIDQQIKKDRESAL